VAGVHKGGSTALYAYLAQHGHVRPAACKEINFLTRETLWQRGLPFYRRHFPDMANASYALTGEGTPNYIRNPMAPVRAAEVIPRAKIIVSLRDPTERFISQFVGFVERRLTRLSCESYWRSELRQLRKCIDSYDPLAAPLVPTTKGVSEWEALRLATDPNAEITSLPRNISAPPCQVDAADSSARSPDQQRCVRHSCLAQLHENAIVRSIYADQIVRWLRYFRPNQLLVVQSEAMHANTTAVMQEVAAFLQLRDFNAEELSRFAHSRQGSSHHLNPISQTCDRETMRAFFAPHNKLLQDVLRTRWPKVASRWLPWPAV